MRSTPLPHTTRAGRLTAAIVLVLVLGLLFTGCRPAQPSAQSPSNVEMVYIMGGAIDVPGNLLPDYGNTVAEWNIFIDPTAAKIVLRSGLPVTLVPLDATNCAPLNQAFYDRLAADHGSAEADFGVRVVTEEGPTSGQTLRAEDGSLIRVATAADGPPGLETEPRLGAQFLFQA